MDFVEAVREESDDAVNDGHLGAFGKGRMVPEFETVAFSLAEVKSACEDSIWLAFDSASRANSASDNPL